MMISQVKILKGIPFNANDKVVITFDSIESQYTFFNRHTIADYRNISFVKGFLYKKIKIDVDFEEVKYANYIMFKNTDLEDDRWNYAYIQNIEYISECCTYIEIEMDYFQTYMGDIVFGECVIDRMMTYDDDFKAIENWEEEPDIEIDNYIMTGIDSIDFKKFKICVCYKPNIIVENLKDETQILTGLFKGDNQVNYRDYRSGDYAQYFRKGGFIPDIYVTGCAFRVYDISNQSQFDSLINDLWILETAGYTIINVYVIPAEFDTPNLPYTKPIKLNGSKNPYYKTDKSIKIYEDDYTPVNNKCYTSPYMYLEISNRQGDIRKYYYQLLSEEYEDGEFILAGNFMNQCNAILMPVSYKASKNASGTPIANQKFTYDYGVPIKEMPACQWNDLLVNFARNGIALIPDIISAVATGGATSLQLATKVMGAVTDPSTKGNQPMPILQLLLQTVGWSIKQYTCSNIHLIDDYFSTFGYKIKNSVMPPNILGNRRFNYVKTKQAIIRGDIPINARNDIINKLNEGITFWHDLTNFDYGDFRGTYSNEIIEKYLTDRGTIF